MSNFWELHSEGEHYLLKYLIMSETWEAVTSTMKKGCLVHYTILLFWRNRIDSEYWFERQMDSELLYTRISTVQADVLISNKAVLSNNWLVRNVCWRTLMMFQFLQICDLFSLKYGTSPVVYYYHRRLICGFVSHFDRKKNFNNDAHGVFRGPWPPLAKKKSVFDIGKKLENMVWPPVFV